MSKRTANANSAIASRWLQEQQLVANGQGTRDWTPEQQRQILERGKVYDDNGRAFEGHHMKSVEQFPEYQGDSDNIQILSRLEHFSAHNGNFQNYTNGYYNALTGETTDFGEGRYHPCAVVCLSEPIYLSDTQMTRNEQENVPTTKNDRDGDGVEQAKPRVLNAHAVENRSSSAFDNQSVGSNESPVISENCFFVKVGRAVQSFRDFCGRHPYLAAGAKAFGVYGLTQAANKVLSHSDRSSSKNSDFTDIGDKQNTSHNPVPVGDLTDVVTHSDCVNKTLGPRSSPDQHTVHAHTQRYNGIEKEKAAYTRGKKKE